MASGAWGRLQALVRQLDASVPEQAALLAEAASQLRAARQWAVAKEALLRLDDVAVGGCVCRPLSGACGC